MKKIIFLLLLSVLMISLIGCDNSNKTDSHTHIDENKDQLCDVCGKKMEIKECAVHMDDDGDGICDVCGKVLKEGNFLEGIFVLTKKEVEGIDLSSSAMYDYLEFARDLTVKEIVVDATGKSEKSYNYELKSDAVVLKQGVYEYSYAYDKEKGTLSFSGMISKKRVVLEYASDSSFHMADTTGSVSFTDELFGDDLTKNFYNYCPSAFLEDASTMHMYYCGNLSDGNVTDYIMYRKGTLSADGKWTFTEKQIALEHGETGTWDARHACDPSVIKGEFTYLGENYSYLMAYLGCYTSDVTCNEVGIAVSKKPEGPWVKVGDQSKAFRSYYDSTDFGSDGGSYWGYGQPSLLSVDGKGKVLLFYTKGVKLGTYTYVEEWDLANLDSPTVIREAKLGDSGSIGIINNADFAYDPVNKMIYMIKEDHENGWYPSDGGVNWISGSNTVYYLACVASDEEFCDVLFRNHSWAKVATIGKNETGFARNHNCGFLTDAYGSFTNYEKITCLYTMSYLKTDYPSWGGGGQWPALHTYRIYGYVIER